MRWLYVRLVVWGIAVTALFCWLLARGWWNAELSTRTVLLFVALFVAGLIGFPYLSIGRGAFVAWVAVLDVALVLMALWKHPGAPGTRRN